MDIWTGILAVTVSLTAIILLSYVLPRCIGLKNKKGNSDNISREQQQ